jgi:hypothetical protein
VHSYSPLFPDFPGLEHLSPETLVNAEKDVSISDYIHKEIYKNVHICAKQKDRCIPY